MLFGCSSVHVTVYMSYYCQRPYPKALLKTLHTMILTIKYAITAVRQAHWGGEVVGERSFFMGKGLASMIPKRTCCGTFSTLTGAYMSSCIWKQLLSCSL